MEEDSQIKVDIVGDIKVEQPIIIVVSESRTGTPLPAFPTPAFR